MSEIDQDFLNSRKINLKELQRKDGEELDPLTKKARDIENARLRAFPFSLNEVKRANAELYSDLLHATFDTCLNI